MGEKEIMVTVSPGDLTEPEKKKLRAALEEANEVNRREDDANVKAVVESIRASHRILADAR